MSARLAEQQATGRVLMDVPEAEYHRRELGVASATVLKMLREKTPAHYRAWLDAAAEADTPSLLFGRAYHCRVLQPEVYARTYAVMPAFGDMRSSTSRGRRDAWLDQHPGMLFLSADDSERIEAMHAALSRHPLAAGIFAEGHAEVTMRWTDPETSVECKARHDWFRPAELVADLKSTDDAGPAAFARSVDRYGYHLQHAHYIEGAIACGEAVPNFLIVAQEKEPPYLVAVYQIDAAAELRGYELRARGLQTLRHCLDTDTWPGHAPGITELSLPAWALKD
ncbi:PD-(D/E)XK nuclease-like domain-containing protein [Lysobacter sp. ESA13C]|uniref:PD-(D/E)XK nuclease-like domain-containing protein n=1 Tax=Lysobacter sp. ESA13C TaxID=2862676 RepID=UPI001CBB3DB4|nr:PD-(D/E)XK nuclease-like domain-containing protein [Lysobacter sp. ESA13C]